VDHPFLIVGLGNPGRDYAATRHNAGFMVADYLVARWRTSWNLEKRFKARVAKSARDDHAVWICQPQTFMNASGEAVQSVRTFYQVPPENILVIVDDADLPLGEIRLRPKGGTGGHHGLESVEQYLGSQDYARQRIGIGRRDPGSREITEHVLGRFGKDETVLLEKVLLRSCEQVECWLAAGIQPAMNRFNGTVEI
jgi:peptidyl-tRNA hydrolase, PTH1 family